MPKKKSIKVESSSDSGSEEEGEGQFVVEVITKARAKKKNKWDYYVKWAGYGSDHNSWEPQENVEGCDRLLKSFWTNIGLDNDDYEPGHIVRATPSWIKKEKERFQKEFGAKESSEMESPEERPATAHKHTDEEPSRKPGPRKKPKKVKHEATSKASVSSSQRGRASIVITDDGESSDDRPLVVNLKKRTKSVTISDSDVEIKKPPAKKPMLTLNTDVKQDKPPVSRKGKEKQQVGAVSAAERLTRERAGSLFSESEASSQDMALSEQVSAMRIQPEKDKTGSKESSTKPPPAPEKDKASAKPGPTKLTERRGIKPMPMPLTGGSGGISTKARVAQGLHTPTTPSVASPAVPPTAPKDPLKGLSFKKKKPTEDIIARNASFAAPAAAPSPAAELGPSVSRREKATVSILEDAPFVQSPVSVQDAGHEFPFGPQSPAELPPDPRRRSGPPPLPRSRPAPPPLPRNVASEPAPVTPVDNTMMVVDDFLSTVMPAELAAPMSEEIEERPLAVPLPRLSKQTSIVSQTSTSETGLDMFQWTGDLFIDVNHDKAERLGNAKLSCITNPRPAGLRFSVCFRAADSLRLQKLHPAADLYVLLRRCAPVQQLAKLEPQSDDDKDGLSTLSSYMQRGDLFTYAKATMDEAPIGHLFVFPDSSTEICKIFQVPQDSRNKGSLLCALVPFKLTPDECRRLNYRETHTPEAHVLNNIPMDKLSLAIQRTLHVLRFPEGLHNFLTTKRRTYYIWHTSDSPSPKAPGYETLMLMDILKRYEAAPATHKDYLSVIFVHAGALDAFRKFESLAERRRRECEVRFYIYGTHESVPPSRWGLREIYPIGGVVTFTPAAIIMDPIGVVELIQKVEEHPLWTCFILPSVVAMAAKMVCHGTSPLVLLDRGELILEELLRMIEEGSLSLLRSPPLKGQPKVKTDAAREWIARQMGLLGMDSREILEECIKGAARQYMDFGEDELAAAIDEEVLRQMRDMQLQPTIMDDYRRFVVITGAGAEKFRDGMELLPLSLFGFRDDYFLKETANGERPK